MSKATAAKTTQGRLAESSMIRSSISVSLVTRVGRGRASSVRLRRAGCLPTTVARVPRALTAGCSETALRVDEEDAGGNHLLAFPQALAHLDALRKAYAELHGPGLEPAGSHGHEDVLPGPRVHDRVTRDAQGLARVDPEL